MLTLCVLGKHRCMISLNFLLDKDFSPSEAVRNFLYRSSTSFSESLKNSSNSSSSLAESLPFSLKLFIFEKIINVTGLSSNHIWLSFNFLLFTSHTWPCYTLASCKLDSWHIHECVYHKRSIRWKLLHLWVLTLVAKLLPIMRVSMTGVKEALVTPAESCPPDNNCYTADILITLDQEQWSATWNKSRSTHQKRRIR